MDWIRELLTGMCLFGAAASFANSDASAAATNHCECGLDVAWDGSGAVAFGQTASIAVNAIVTNGDGLVNLHEYWADCDPLVYDGTNTAQGEDSEGNRVVWRY